MEKTEDKKTEDSGQGLVSIDQWLPDLMGKMQVGVAYTAHEIAGLMRLVYFNPEIICDTLRGEHGTVANGRVLMIMDKGSKVRFRVDLVNSLGDVPGVSCPVHGGYPDGGKSKFPVKSYGMGCVEAAQEAHAQEGYGAYAAYLRGEGHQIPDWHQIPDDMREAFVRFANRLVASRYEVDSGTKKGVRS